jgi:hypothetical protein
VEIGSCEGPIAGLLINLFARGMRQLANRRELNKKKTAILERSALLPEIIQQLCRNHNYLVTRLSVHRGKEGHVILAPQKVLNRGSSSVVEALASLGMISFSTEKLLPWIRKADLHVSCCKIVFRSRFLYIVNALDLLNRK